MFEYILKRYSSFSILLAYNSSVLQCIIKFKYNQEVIIVIFEEAIYISANDKRMYSIEDVTELRKHNFKEYNRIKNNLFCPECEQPHLTHKLCSTKANHFSTHIGDKHKDECSFNCEKASTKTLESFVKDGTSLDQLYNRLQNAIVALFKTKKPKTNPFIIRSTETSDKSVSKPKVTSHKKNYYIPKKRITNGLSNDDVDVYKIFYGYVRMVCKKDKYGYNIFMFNPNNPGQDMICSLSVSDNVIKYIGLDGTSRFNCYVSFFSVFSQNKRNEKTFYNGRISHSKEFYFTKTL